MTCKNCVYWSSDPIKDSVWGECDCPKFFYGYGYDMGILPKDGVLVEDDEGWGMFTGPDFKCAHWVAKPY